MTQKKVLVIFILLFSFVTGNISSKESYKFHTFSPKGGFYYDGVKSILQDREGFIWILMDNNIQRFDGYEYKNYYTTFNNFNISSKWIFYDVETDSSGLLYVATNNGLFTYNRTKDSFDIFLSEPATNMSIDKNDNIWLTYNNKLLKYDKQTNSLCSLFLNNKEVTNIVHFDTKGDDIYLATPFNSIYRYNEKENSDSITLFYEFPQKYNIIDFKQKEKKLWVLVNNYGLYKIDINNKRIEDHFDFPSQYDGENILAKKIYIDKTGKIWIATQQGLFILNPITRAYEIYRHSTTDIFSLPNNSIWTIAEDLRQNIWIGTYSGGLSYVNIDEYTWFSTYTTEHSPLNQDLVSCFAEDEYNIWIGTEGGGINRMDKKTKNFTHYKHDKNKNSLSFNNVKSIAVDSKKNLWIAMFRGGLNYYDIKKDKFIHYQKTENKNSLLTNDLRKITLEKDSGLWIAYQLDKAEISFLSFKDNSFNHYTLDSADNSSYIFDIQRDHEGNIWAVTRQKLYRLDAITREPEVIISEKESLINGQSLYIDKNNNVWIGTVGNGLLKYNPKTKELTEYKDILNFDILTIYSICADLYNCLWLGTDNGLIRYNIEKDSYSKFDETDGLQGQVYYPLACMIDKSGQLYFGGTNGFTIINPEKIKQNQARPNVILSDFLIDNVSALPIFENQTSNLSENTFVLNHKQTNFGFKFSSDNYLIPQKNLFRYRLKGYDDQWITTDADNRTAYYSKVPPGKYQFEIQTANNDGLWNDEPTIIKIERLPSPWLSKTAYTSYAILGLIILGIIIYYYRDKRRLRMQLYLENLDKQKKEEIHQSQLNFFTNISHDFRTPLSLILATVDNLKQAGIKEYYYKILHNNSIRLLNLVNELMDFRTVENGKMQLRVQPVDLNSLIKELSSDFQDYARKHNLNFKIVTDTELDQKQIYIDKQIFEKIIMNLLNNAFKYTQDGGAITIESYAHKSSFKSVHKNFYTVTNNEFSDPSFLIVIKDTGIGITKDSIANVFDRFYKVKATNSGKHLGTGIGLALVRSLVLLHKGEISIFSERDKGTDIVVSLPLNPAIYNKNELFNPDSQMEETALSLMTNKNNTNNIPASSHYLEEKLLRDKKRILIVEDNNDLRTLMSNFLSTSYDIKEACNGVEAIEILNSIEVDLIISDIMMPLKDGVTLLKEVRADMNTSHIPFVLLTAKTALETKLESTESGVDIYFEKPIDLNLLLLSVQNIFSQRQKLREYYSKNFFSDSVELSTNERDNNFLRKMIEILDININSPTIDVNYIASELSISRSKLYSKIKMITGMSIVEFILQYRLRKAARILIEQDWPVYQVMEEVGIRSQSYFTSAFKKEFGETPTAFVTKHKKKKKPE